MIRFLLVCITVIGFLILSIPILIVEWIIGKFNPYKKDTSSLHLIQSVFRFILWLTGVEVTVIGEELVPTDEAKLVVVGDGAAFDAIPCTDSLMQCITDRLPKPANPTA